MALTVVWKTELKLLKTWSVKVIMGVLAVMLLCVMPRYGYNKSDRVQLIYQNEDYEITSPPFYHYLINVFFPEEEICNLGIWGGKLIPKRCFPRAGWILEEFKYENKRDNTGKLLKPYHMLNRKGLFPMSGTTAQVCNMMGIDNTRSVYLIKPKNYDKNKAYPVLFFMHGYLGNWKNYAGVFLNIEDCLVLCVGTRDLSGIYNSKDIKELYTKQILFLEKLGYKVDRNNLHIAGLSNGGSASDMAYKYHSLNFKSIAFISTGIHQTSPITSKVLLVGGGKDHSAGSLPTAYKTLQKNGTQVDMYWKDEDSHFIMLVQLNEVISFLNKNYNP